MAGGAGEQDDERRSRRGRSTRDRHGRARAQREPGTSWSRGKRTPQDEEPRRAVPARQTRTLAARPDSPPRTRSVRDSGRPSTRRRPRSDAVRARRTEPGERRAPTRARYLTRRWVAVLVVLSVLAVAYLVMFTPLLGVRSVEVTGVREIPEEDVLAAADIQHGTPMVRLDADEAAARVAKLPRVFEVRVERSWPSTVDIIVTERSPVAVLKNGNVLHLIDATGLDYAVTRTPPAGLPTLAQSNVNPGNPATIAVVTVLGAIPPQLKTQVVAVSADTPGDVRMTLSDGRVVEWGDARDNDRKAAVLGALLTRPGKTYDVATPDFPTVSG
jgi:cell division protein FtsQ